VIWPAWMGIPIRPTKVYAATDLFNSHRPDQVAHNRQYALPGSTRELSLRAEQQGCTHPSALAPEVLASLHSKVCGPTRYSVGNRVGRTVMAEAIRHQSVSLI
jgi:hypothetical protein